VWKTWGGRPSREAPSNSGEGVETCRERHRRQERAHHASRSSPIASRPTTAPQKDAAMPREGELTRPASSTSSRRAPRLGLSAMREAPSRFVERDVASCRPPFTKQLDRGRRTPKLTGRPVRRPRRACRERCQACARRGPTSVRASWIR